VTAFDVWPGIPRCAPATGRVCHAFELPFVFDNPVDVRLATAPPEPGRRFSPSDQAVADTLAGYWTRFATTLDRLKGLSPRLLVLGDNPASRDDPATCLSAHLNDVTACDNTRVKAIEAGKLDAERTIAKQDGARFVDTSDWLCTETDCPVIIGDILMFRDINHLTTVAADWFTPMINAVVMPYLHGG
jgi:hypothetical protein